MSHLFVLLTAQLLHLPTPVSPAKLPVPMVLEYSYPTPADSADVVERAAMAYTAYLTDLLSLTPTQRRQLAQPTRRQLRLLVELPPLPDNPGAAEAAATAVVACYHQQLVRVLTTSQYGNLLSFSAWLPALPHRRSQQEVNTFWSRKNLPAHYVAAKTQ